MLANFKRVMTGVSYCQEQPECSFGLTDKLLHTFEGLFRSEQCCWHTLGKWLTCNISSRWQVCARGETPLSVLQKIARGPLVHVNLRHVTGIMCMLSHVL